MRSLAKPSPRDSALPAFTSNAPTFVIGAVVALLFVLGVILIAQGLAS